MNLSQVLKDLCLEREIKIIDLAKEVDIQNSLLYKYVNEIAVPTVNNVVKLANYFDCTINFLVGISNNPKEYDFCDTFDKNTFFVRYCELLKEFGVSHYQICKKFNLAKSVFWLWKKGSVPYMDTLTNLALYFDVSIDYLIGRSKQR